MALWACCLQINTRDLTSGERIQLAGVLLQAWTAFQQQDHHQQSSQCVPTLLNITMLWAS